MVAVKICCIADVAEARLAQAAGASAIGLVSAMPSGPGVIADGRIAEIAAALRDAPIRSFLLTSRTSAQAIHAQLDQARPTTVQLVDEVPPAELERLRDLCPGVELVQVIHVTGPEALAQAQAVAPLVDALLLDSGNPSATVKELGGTGRTHDWPLARRIRDAVWPRPLWLAGGLNAGNVAQAIALVRPHGVDVCSGVRSGGVLDAVRLAAFIGAASPRPPA